MAAALLDEMQSRDGEVPFTEEDVRAVLATMYAGMYPNGLPYDLKLITSCSRVRNCTFFRVADTRILLIYV